MNDCEIVADRRAIDPGRCGAIARGLAFERVRLPESRLRAGLDDSLYLIEVKVHGVTAAVRHSLEELEGKIKIHYRPSEVRLARAIPGDDAVEAAETGQQQGRTFDCRQAEQVQTGGSDRANPIGKADQGHVPFAHPYFEVAVLQRFDCGKRNDQVTNGSRPDDQSSHQPAGRILDMSL